MHCFLSKIMETFVEAQEDRAMPVTVAWGDKKKIQYLTERSPIRAVARGGAGVPGPPNNLVNTHYSYSYLVEQ